MGNTVSSPSGQSPVYDRQTFPRNERKLVPKANTIGRSDNRNQSNGNQENSRMLFLMYLINRTWNVVVDGKPSKRLVSSIYYGFVAPKLKHALRAPKLKLKTRKRQKQRDACKPGTVFTFIST